MVVKPSCNYHFWCLWLEENKNFVGCIKNFLKNLRSKKFFCKKLNRKFWKIQFLQKNFYQTVLFNIKYQFEIISAFIWCIYCQYLWKIIEFQKFFVLKAENFVPSDEVTLASNFGNIMNHRMVFKDFFRRIKTKNVIWDHLL